MFNKFFILLFIFINIFLNLHADEKQLIINRLSEIENLTFDFSQLTNNKKEEGTCILVFDNKLVCDYADSIKKRIIINGKTLVIQQKRYNKNYFYPISKSIFINIFNKKNLINLIRKSDYQLGNNIRLTHVNENKGKIIIFFKKKTYDIVGWEIIDQLQNIISFSIKIQFVNSEINPKIFLIPTIN